MGTCPECHARYADDVTVCEKDGAPLVPSTEREIAPGDQIGDYKVESKLGEGGFGVVYRAVHPLIGKAVAIKVLARRYSADPEMVSRFVTEARSVNRIKHKNIVDIFAFGTLPDGRAYSVMELLDGVPLDVHLDRLGRLSPGEAMPILLGVARALDAAHAAGIAHRDLKPENVFLAHDEDHGFSPKLLDFGIAKLFGDPAKEHQTRTGVPIGTPFYMSPEQCRGKPVDHRTDIYSFGVLAYALLTGTLPFTGDSSMDVMMKHVSEPPTPPSARVAGLSPLFDAPIAHMLAKDPTARPASALSAIEELAQAARAAGHNDVQIPQVRSSLAPSRERGISSSPTLPVGMTPSALAALASADTLAQATTASSGPSITAAGSRRPRQAWVIGAVLVGGVALALVVGTRGTRTAPLATASLSGTPTQADLGAPPVPMPAPSVASREAPAEVDLVVKSVPEKVDVYLGERRLGTAPGPLRLERSTNALELELRAEGYAPLKLEVTPSADRIVSATLKKKPRPSPAQSDKKSEVEF